MSTIVMFPLVDRSADAEPACAQHDPAWWFEERHFERARTICRSCAYRTRCLDLAFANREGTGVWGGLTPAERERLPDAVVVPFRAGRRKRTS